LFNEVIFSLHCQRTVDRLYKLLNRIGYHHRRPTLAFGLLTMIWRTSKSVPEVSPHGTNFDIVALEA